MFSTLDVYKNLLELDVFKCKLITVYVAEFAQQASSIENVAEMRREIELNHAKVTKLQCWILIIPATSASGDRVFSSVSRVNSYMRFSLSKDRWRHFISL